MQTRHRLRQEKTTMTAQPHVCPKQGNTNICFPALRHEHLRTREKVQKDAKFLFQCSFTLVCNDAILLHLRPSTHVRQKFTLLLTPLNAKVCSDHALLRLFFALFFCARNQFSTKIKFFIETFHALFRAQLHFILN